MSAPLDAESAYQKHLPAALALAPDAVRPYHLDVDLAIVNIQTALPAIVALKSLIPSHLPKIDLVAVLAITDLAMAVKFAELRAEQAVPTQKGINEALKKARAARRLLLAATKALVESGLVPKEQLAPILDGSGSRDVAEDCVALANLLRNHEAKIAGKHALTKEQIDEAAALGSWLLMNMRTEGAPAEKAGAKPAEIDIRDRLATLLWRTHAELRKIAYYFHGDHFDEVAPPLQSRSLKRDKKGEEEPK